MYHQLIIGLALLLPRPSTRAPRSHGYNFVLRGGRSVKWLAIVVIWFVVWFAWIGETKPTKFSLGTVLGSGLVALFIFTVIVSLAECRLL